MINDDDLQAMLADGRLALQRVAELGPVSAEKAIVCFHFSSEEDDRNDRWGEDAQSVLLARPLFRGLPFKVELDEVGGCVGIEAWERVTPTPEWLEDRLPRMLDIARKAQMTFQGWSFEPKGYSIVSSGSELNVVNANTPEGRAVVDAMIEEVQDKAKAIKH